MTNRNTILNELAGLNSCLTNQDLQNNYTVPEGYFDGLAKQIMNRIKALETTDAKKEIEHLSTMLSTISKELPFSVPVGYFGNLDENILEKIRNHSDYLTSGEEIESLSPLLSKLQKETPYSVPAGYFENFTPGIKKVETKFISITKRRWYRIAVAASIIGIIIIGGFLFFGSNKIDINKNPEKWIAKNVQKKVSTDKIDEFVTLAESDVNQKTEETSNLENVQEINELIKDVPEKELEDFLNDAIALESNNDIDAILNE